MSAVYQWIMAAIGWSEEKTRCRPPFQPAFFLAIVDQRIFIQARETERDW